VLVVPEENAGTNCFNGVRWVIGENFKDLLINMATPPPSLLGRAFLRM
jgi:hypothetical protein